jgi:hypothetical protein
MTVTAPGCLTRYDAVGTREVNETSSVFETSPSICGGPYWKNVACTSSPCFLPMSVFASTLAISPCRAVA